MNKRVWMNVMMAVLVAGLFLTVSCAKKTIVAEPTSIVDQAKLDAEAKARAEAEARAEEERIKAQALADQLAKEKALREAGMATAKDRFVNENVQFEFDSSELTAMAIALLKDKADYLNENSGLNVVIEGHCDERGTTEYNIALGERRAVTVKNYLVNLGISGSRLTTVSFGEERPLDPAENEAAYSKNRRAQFVIE